MKWIFALAGLIVLAVGISALQSEYLPIDYCPSSVTFSRSDTPLPYLFVAMVEIAGGAYALLIVLMGRPLNFRVIAFFFGCYFCLMALAELELGHTFTCYFSLENVLPSPDRGGGPYHAFLPYARDTTPIAYWSRVAFKLGAGSIAILCSAFGRGISE